MLERVAFLLVKMVVRGPKAEVRKCNEDTGRITPDETFPSRYAKINGRRYAAVRDFFITSHINYINNV